MGLWNQVNNKTRTSNTAGNKAHDNACKRSTTMTDKKLAKKILDYWYTMEMLHQDALPKKQYGKKGKFSVVTEEVRYDENLLDKIQQHAQKLEMASCSNITCYIGSIEREVCIEKIAELMEQQIDSPDKIYDKIAWASLQITNKGAYVEESFSLSPVIWAIKELSKTEKTKSTSSRITSSAYEEAIRYYEEKLVDEQLLEVQENGIDKNVAENVPKPLSIKNLRDLHKKIWTEYIRPVFSVEENSLNSIFIMYTLYESTTPPEPENDDYCGLHMDFFSTDIQMVRIALENVSNGFDNAMGKNLLEYIVSPTHKEDKHNNRVDLVPGENNIFNIEKFYDILSEILDVKKAPLGKWPSQFMPALMQQMAVNLFINQKIGKSFGENGAIFSVNGPPGTGKTTLLKEVIVHNVVERACLLVNYEEPKDAFEHENYTHGPVEDHSYNKYVRGYYRLRNDKINQYGVLVTSCNNAAVENISKELPLEIGITGAFDEEDAAQQEVRNLFDMSKTELRETLQMNGLDGKEVGQEVPDIYFSQYATNLLQRKDGKGLHAWGLMAAALGKKSNINKFAQNVLIPLVTKDFLKTNYAIQERIVKWKKIRNEFKKQLKKVQDMQKCLSKRCEAERNIRKLSISVQARYDDFTKAKDEFDICKEVQDGMPDNDEQLLGIREKISDFETRYQKKGFIFKRRAENDFNTQIDANIKKLKEQIKQIENNEEAIQGLQDKMMDKKEKYIIEKRKLKQMKSTYTDIDDMEGLSIDEAFMKNFVSDDLARNTKAQVDNPWFSPEYNREREKLFYLAMQVHKEFVLSSKECRTNLNNLMMIWRVHPQNKAVYHPDDRRKSMAALLQTLWLLVPVISTTFASVGRLLQDVREPSVLGTLIVDEAGQAQPQMAVGSLFRVRQAIIVGDPKQIEPVITAELDLLKQSYDKPYYIPYRDKKNSVQQFSDQLNSFGTWLSADDNPEIKEWVGCPLLVHRRCTEPMYSIANQISYNGIMKQQTRLPDSKKMDTFSCAKSIWLDVQGAENGNKDHFVKAQGDAVSQIIEKAFSLQEGMPSVYIISPFKSVVHGIRQWLLNADEPLLQENKNFKVWCQTNIGTVHTFQGKEANEVIFLLGCDTSAGSDGAIRWVNNNIVNVAATRAKYRLCVVGNREAWKKSSSVGKMMEILDSNNGENAC